MLEARGELLASKGREPSLFQTMSGSMPVRVLDIRPARARMAKRPLGLDTATVAGPATIFRPRPSGPVTKRAGIPPNRVLKFGGSSVATPDRIRGVARIVLDAAGDACLVVVVSAFQGITNQLLECARLAEQRDSAYRQAFETIAARHRSAIEDLFAGCEQERLGASVEEQLQELRTAVESIHLLGRSCPADLDLVASFGERLSASIVAAYLDPLCGARYVDAREFVRTDDQFTHANVLAAKTNRATRGYFSAIWSGREHPVPVVTGFIGATVDGRTTTIGRNGSDYTASIIGAALRASAIEIWTDVDGVLSADPKTVPSAFVLPQITYQQATEMSYFGAKVLHPAAVAPAVAKSVPIIIKNTLNPDAPGTLIRSKVTDGHRLATGISSLGNLTLLTVHGSNEVGIAGTAERLFRALASRNVKVMLSTQASSEATISVAVHSSDAGNAADAISHEFRFELEQGLTVLERKSDQAIIAMIGEGVKARPEGAWNAFGALRRHRINVSAIAQAVSSRNLACVVDASDESRALNVIHRGFFEERKPLALAVIGVGRVGGALLSLLEERREFLNQRFDVRVVALADSKRFVVAAEGIDLAAWRETLDASREAMDVDALTAQLAALDLPHAAVIDCTADAGIVDGYSGFVNANLHIITPNKRANVLPWRRYAALMDLLAERRKHFFYEANVGAGLPVISTLRDLIASGDRIVKVEGIVSGTLSYLFNAFDGTVPFSALVCDAQNKGLTEPDPREDLSGQDVARKLLILARESGVKMELQDVQVESLVPGHLQDGPFSPDFFRGLATHDCEIVQRLEAARSRGAVLRYVATLENGKGRAGLQEVGGDHPLAAVKGTDNVIAFTTTRYANTPLVVQGPGAGAEVTAMGVFSDLLKLLNLLPR
jgi:bifunctional aspartokinase / homoserine dehydrogenase 1